MTLKDFFKGLEHNISTLVNYANTQLKSYEDLLNKYNESQYKRPDITFDDGIIYSHWGLSKKTPEEKNKNDS